MRKKLLYLAIAIALTMALLTSPATAGTIQTLQFTGTGGIVSGNYYTFPYFGTLNGVPELFMCVDDAHSINNGDMWQAYIGSPVDLSHAYYQGSDAAQIYGEEFTLLNDMLVQWGLYQTGTSTQQAAAGARIQFLQPVAWGITNPGSQVLSADQETYLSGLETQNLTTGFDNWRIASDINGEKQELFYQTPEPKSYLMFCTGLIAVGFLRRRTKK
jgi:hypothetical protein